MSSIDSSSETVTNSNTNSNENNDDQGEECVKRLPIPSDPNHIYTIEDDFPPLSYFERRDIYPALIVPAKVTNLIKSKLGPFLLRKKRTRNVFPVLESEACNTAVGTTKTTNDHRQERKIVLVNRLPSSTTAASNITAENDSTSATHATNHSTSKVQIIIAKAVDTLQQNAEHAGEETITLSDILPSIRPSSMELSITYEDYTVDEVLSQLLPLPYVSTVSTAFETVGHLAHLNLPSHLKPFKYIIAKVIADKNQPTIQIVVNKLSTIQNEFRTFPMEILYKSSSTSTTKQKPNNQNNKDNDEESLLFEVQVKQGGCIFHLNFAQVYWNSRLQFEHERLVQYILAMHHQQQDSTPVVIADVMAGVGPFSVPLSLAAASNNNNYHNIQVHANDLNPISYQYLQTNFQMNHKRHKTTMMKEKNYQCYNLDGRIFLHQLLWDQKIHISHCIMNLPAIAIDFLDAFRGYNPSSSSSSSSLPPTVMHVYCFETKKEEEAKASAIQRCEVALGCSIEKILDIHIVRDVSPNTNMMCISFLLPSAIALVPPRRTSTGVSDDTSNPTNTMSASLATKHAGENSNKNCLLETGNNTDDNTCDRKKDPKRAKVLSDD